MRVLFVIGKFFGDRLMGWCVVGVRARSESAPGTLSSTVVDRRLIEGECVSSIGVGQWHTLCSAWMADADAAFMRCSLAWFGHQSITQAS